MNSKFGLIINSCQIESWQYDAVKRIVENTSFELSLLIYIPKGNLKTFSLSALYQSVFLVPKKYNTCDVRLLNEASVTLHLETYDLSQAKVSPKDVDYIKNKNLDFMIDFNCQKIPNEIMSICKYGVWYFQFGNSFNPKLEAGYFWDIYHDNPCSEISLQTNIFNHKDGALIEKGCFKTLGFSHKKNLARARKLVVDWPLKACIKITNSVFDTNESNCFLQKQNSNRSPGLFRFLIFPVKLVKNLTKHFFRRYTIIGNWNVGLVRKTIEDFMDKGINPEEITWIPRKNNIPTYADPFFLGNNEKVVILERILTSSLKGDIVAFDVENNFTQLNEFAISELHHLSYPNSFSLNKRLYCLPESAAAKKLLLYEWTNQKWEKHLIMEGAGFIDPEIISHNGLFYLFCTIKGDFHDTKMQIYHSDNILKGWTAHPLNPVVTDVRSARGAGKIFRYRNELYRPGQNYSKKRQGSITISRVIALSPLDYREEIVKEIFPIEGTPYPDKIHTINFSDNYTLIDSCKTTSLIAKPLTLYKLIRKKLL